MFADAFDKMQTARVEDSKALYGKLHEITTDMLRNAMDKVGILLGNLDATKREDGIEMDNRMELKKRVKAIVLKWAALWRVPERLAQPAPNNDIPEDNIKDEPIVAAGMHVDTSDSDSSSGSDSG